MSTHDEQQTMLRDINRAAGGCPPIILMGEIFLIKYERLHGSNETDAEILARFAHCRRPDGIYEIRARA